MLSNPGKVEAYFQAREIELLRKHRQEREQKRAAKEKEDLKNLHYMHCPKCGTKMEVIKMQEIEVDKCPQCWGVYFDDNELEQLMEIESKKRRSVVRALFGLK